MNSVSRSPRRISDRKSRLLAAIGAIALAALVLFPLAPAAHARLGDEAPVGDATYGANTEIVLTGLGSGQNVTGFQPPTVITPDPLAAYPDTPPAGYTSVSTFAGTLETAAVSDPSLTAEMYCINLRVSTQVGIGYASGTWEESNVPNIGYVTYILNNYFPTVPTAPGGLTPDQQGAAVQAAIWFFTDGFILGTEPAAVRTATAAIIAAAQAAGPVVEPPAPDVTITPPAASAADGTAAGPYVVAAEGAAEVTVTVPTGYAMYTDASATTALPSPSTVASGTSIWVTGPGVTGVETVLSARAEVTVQRGEVYLYDGNTPSVSDAQRLILAQTTILDAVASATAEFFAVGELTVNKAFAGPAVGEQGAIQLIIDCGAPYTFTADIPAGTSATQTFTYSGIPAGSTCTVTEPTTGATAAVSVTTDAPQDVVLAQEGSAVTVTNTVDFLPGGLNVVKVVTGTGAGLQSDISVAVSCENGLEETLVIPAGSAAGDYVESFTDLPAGTVCTVTESASGANTLVTVESDAPVTVTIAPGATVDAVVTNTVTPVPTPTPTPTPTTPGGLSATGGEVPFSILSAGGVVLVLGSILLAAAYRSRRSGTSQK